MRIRADSAACAGHARCNQVAPGLYELDDNGYIATSGFTVGPDQEQLAMRGARACPERVIHILDEAPAGEGGPD